MPDPAASLKGRPALSQERTVAGAAIGAAGMAVPDRVIANAPIADRLDVDDDWILSRTGVAQRHAMEPGERLSDLAAAAGRSALERAKLDAGALDLVLVGTTSKDELTPDSAPIVAAEIGATSAGAVDIGAACTGFVSAVALAQGQIESGRAQHVLVIGADALVQYLDPEDRRTAGLFGDGAGAVVMSRTDPPGRIGPPVLRCDGSQAGAIYADKDERKVRMQGQDTFQQAVLRLTEVTREAVEAAGTDMDSIDLFVYHQANGRILSAVGERLELPTDRVVDTVECFANTSAASIPIALAETQDADALEGKRLLLAAIGAGLTWGGIVVDWGLEAA